MKLAFSKRFRKDYLKVKDAALQARIQKQLVKIREDPEVGKPLRYDLFGLWSVRVPPFRIIYEIRGEAVLIHEIANRDDVYE